MSQRFTVIKASEESPIGEGSDSYGTVKNGQIAGDIFITYDFVSFTSLCIKDRNE